MLITFWKCIKKFKQTSVHFIFSFKNNQVQFQMVIILMYWGQKHFGLWDMLAVCRYTFRKILEKALSSYSWSGNCLYFFTQL